MFFFSLFRAIAAMLLLLLLLTLFVVNVGLTVCEAFGDEQAEMAGDELSDVLDLFRSLLHSVDDDNVDRVGETGRMLLFIPLSKLEQLPPNLLLVLCLVAGVTLLFVAQIVGRFGEETVDDDDDDSNISFVVLFASLFNSNAFFSSLSS